MEEIVENWDTNIEETEPIIEVPQEPIKVYIRINANNEITEINSEIFIQDLTNWTEIDSGFGDKYAHAQSQYLDKPIINEDGSFAYKYENNKVVEL